MNHDNDEKVDQGSNSGNGTPRMIPNRSGNMELGNMVSSAPVVHENFLSSYWNSRSQPFLHQNSFNPNRGLAKSLGNSTSIRANHALQYRYPSRVLEVTLPLREPSPYEIVVQVTHAGVSLTDLHIVADAASPRISKIVPGQDVAGRVAVLGRNVTCLSVGEYVVVCPHAKVSAYPLHSDSSSPGLHTNPQFVQVGRDCRTLGINTNGAWAQFVGVHMDQVFKIPEKLHGHWWSPLVYEMSSVLYGMQRLQQSLERMYEPRILIIGGGVLSLLWIIYLRRQGYLKLNVLDYKSGRSRSASQFDVTVTLVDASEDKSLSNEAKAALRMQGASDEEEMDDGYLSNNDRDSDEEDDLFGVSQMEGLGSPQRRQSSQVSSRRTHFHPALNSAPDRTRPRQLSVAQLLQQDAPEGFEIVIDCSGNGAFIEAAIENMNSAGTLLLNGVASSTAASIVPLSALSVLSKELCIMGNPGNPCTFGDAIQVVTEIADEFPACDSLGVALFPIAEYALALEKMRRGEISKAILTLHDPRDRNFLASPAAPLLSPAASPSFNLPMLSL